MNSADTELELYGVSVYGMDPSITVLASFFSWKQTEPH